MIRRFSLRKINIFLLVFVLTFQPVFTSFAAQQEPNRHSVAPVTSQDIKKFTEEGIDWSEEQEDSLKGLFTLAAQLDQDAKNFAAQYGEAELQKRIDQNLFYFEDPEIGKIEYRMIDQKRIPRAILNTGDKSYLLVDESILPRSSPHLQQYIARTHMESGAGRPDLDDNGKRRIGIFGNKKEKVGRDLVIVALRQGKISDWSFLPKPKPTQWHWWKEYFLSKYKKPTLNDFTLAMVVGAGVQGSLALGMTALKSQMLGVDFSVEPAVFTALYGLGLGTIVSTYRNWAVLSGTRLTRVLKSTAVSLAYAYGMVLFISPGEWQDKFASISLLTTAGLMQNLSINLNAISNNYAKDYWNQIMRIRDKTRANSEPVKFNFMGIKSFPIEWKRASVESQLLYLIPWMINIFSLMTLASSNMLKIPGTEISVPILQLAAIPFAMLWARWYSRKLANKAKEDPLAISYAKDLEEMATSYDNVWRQSFGMDIKDIPNRIAQRIKLMYSSCADFLRRQISD